MTIESATYISQLDDTNPDGTDHKYEGDNHVRLIKTALSNTLGSLSGAVTSTHTELNLLDGKTKIGEVASEDVLTVAKGGTGSATAVLARAALGLTIGTTSGTIPQLTSANGIGALPAVDGSLLLNLSFTSAVVSGNSGALMRKNGDNLEAATWADTSISATAVAGGRYGITANAVTMTLPLSPTAGDEVYFADFGTGFLVNNLTIARNGETIMGLSENMTVNTNNLSFGLSYTNSDWRLF